MVLAPFGADGGDNPSPGEIDWSKASDMLVLSAVGAGVQQAIDEAESRGLLPFTA